MLGGHTFQISAVVLHLEAPGAYPLLLGRPWLKTTNIKQNWNQNLLTFRKGKTKIRVSAENKITPSKQCLPVHAEAVNIMEGLDEVEENHYFNDNPKIIPLFEVDILQVQTPYVDSQELPLDEQTMKEIRLQQEATEREMKISQRVQASTLEEVNLVEEVNVLEPRTMLAVRDMLMVDKQQLIGLLKQYKDVFAWSFEDMKGLDLARKDAKLVQECRYRLNPNYAIKVNEKIDKLLKVGFI